MPQYVLHYFDARGRAEVSRMILLAGGIEYTDRRFQFQDWPALKPNTPLGQVPYLEVESIALPQSNAIARYLAREANLAGKTNLEQAQADAVVDTCIDALNSFIQKYWSVDDAKAKEEVVKKFVSEEVPKHFNNLEKLIGLYGQNGYSVGDNLTWADIYIYEFISNLETKHKSSVTEKHPRLESIKKIIEEHPKLGPYVKTRPEAAF